MDNKTERKEALERKKEIDRKKISCPILFIRSKINSCVGENCAWYFGDDELCAIKILAAEAQNLTKAITGSGR